MFNKVIFAGHLGHDPSLRNSQAGKAVCSFSLASSEKWTDQAGQRQERTEWANIVAWGQLAETCAKYLIKGSSALVEGRMQTRKWQDKSGADRYTTEIIASNVRFLSGKKDDAGKQGQSIDAPPTEEPADGFDVPF